MCPAWEAYQVRTLRLKIHRDNEQERLRHVARSEGKLDGAIPRQERIHHHRGGWLARRGLPIK